MEAVARKCPYCDETLAPNVSAACPTCGVPLVPEQPDEPEPHHLLAGPLTLVTVVTNQAEAELVQGMLNSEGIPCVVRRAAGADVPDFLAAGRRDVLVPEQALGSARDLLNIVPPAPGTQQQSTNTDPVMLVGALLLGLALMAAAVSIAVLLT